MIRRRRLAMVLAAGTLPRRIAAQPAPSIPVVGRVSPGSAPEAQKGLQAFRDGMRALGQVEGKTYRLDARFAEGDPVRLAPLVAALTRDRVDVIVAIGAMASRLAKQATSTIPIVMAMAGPDPVADGLVESLAHPGGNVTGLTGQINEMQAKQLELLREILPALSDVLVLYNPGGLVKPLQALTATAGAAGLRLHVVAIRQPDDLNGAFDRAASPGTWAVFIMPDPLLLDGLPIAALALRQRLPSAQSISLGAETGGLLSFSIDLPEMHRRSAVFVDKILKGAKPADIPIEQPTVFRLVLNQKTAKALGITIPTTLLARADEVIE